jgi:hypothetical protein
VESQADDEVGLVGTFVGDGRPLLFAVAAALVFAGGFLIFLAATGELLPQDVHYLGLTADDLCAHLECRIVDFMVHDRAAFGGTLVGIGILYAWLTAFPLRRGETWAWWTWVASGSVGFLSFLSYLGYGYLDTWHGIGTALLLPVFGVGLARAHRLLVLGGSPRSLLVPGPWLGARDRYTLGRSLLVLGAGATTVGGLMILRVGVGDTFVPEDLEFIGLAADELRGIDSRLVPLLAHDRAGFGGGVVTLGLTTLLCLWCARPARHLHQAVALAGVTSAGAALGVHFVVGYTDPWHLLPAATGALLLAAGLVLEHPGTPTRDRRLTSSAR